MTLTYVTSFSFLHVLPKTVTAHNFFTAGNRENRNYKKLSINSVCYCSNTFVLET
jgi:hypothetical protein